MRMRRPPVLCVLLTIALSAACAPRARDLESFPPAAASPAPPRLDVPSLITHGCYRCLEAAWPEIATRPPVEAFEVAALLALRAKELGIPQTPWLDRARAVVPDDPAWALYLEIADAIPPDPLSDDRERLMAAALRRRESHAGATERGRVPDWRESLRAGPASPVFRRYLDLAVTCAFEPPPAVEGTARVVLETFPDVPVLVYRAGICSPSFDAHLRGLRDRHPTFVEADYALGRFARDRRDDPDVEEALRYFVSARDAFPESPAIEVTLGAMHEAIERWDEALPAFDRALALVPTHRNGLLGRAASLSHLRRHAEAEATATRLIELGDWFMGQAYYWRAWNRFHLGRVEDARVDADRTRTLMVNPAVFVLSGMIEWRLDRLDTSEEEFEEALQMDFGQCEAALFLGAVRAQRGKPAEALAAFLQARQCFDLSITVRRTLIAEIESGGGSETLKAHRTAVHERAIEDAETRRDEAQQGLEAMQHRGADQGR